jgi:NADH-quinone oxidoreductase subunit I/NAD(P)H-quinone oxidoreductase subunit I
MIQSASEYVGSIRDTVASFWHGMSITLSHVLRRPITIQYPDRTELPVKDTLPPRYRGFLEVDVSICTGCQACERACPISCIEIVLEKDAANPKQRVVSQFDIDEAKCMFCGLCVEPCPTGSIQHTREFEGSQKSIRNLIFRWADPLHPFPVYKVPKGIEYYPRPPLGSLVRALIDQQRWDAPGPQYLPPEPIGPPPPPAPVKPAAAPAAKPAAAAPAAKPAAAAPGPGPAAPGVAAGPATPTPAAPQAPSATPTATATPDAAPTQTATPKPAATPTTTAAATPTQAATQTATSNPDETQTPAATPEAPKPPSGDPEP